MKECGIALLILGGLLAVYAFMMEVGVSTGEEPRTNLFEKVEKPEKVANLSLMNQQQNLVFGAVGLCIMGSIFLVGGVIEKRLGMMHRGESEPVKMPKDIETTPAR